MSTKDTLARLASSDDDPFDFIGRKPKPEPAAARVTTPMPKPLLAKTKQITARLDEDLHRRLKLYLAQTGEEQQELIARLLVSHFDTHDSV